MHRKGRLNVVPRHALPLRVMDEPFDLPPDVLRRVPLFAELQKILSWRGGPVNWELARQIAVSIAAEGQTQILTPADQDEAQQQVRLAELWLTEVTGLPVPARLAQVRAATPADWAEHATVALAELVDPIAAKASRALGEQMGALGAAGAPEAMIAQAIGQVAPMFMGIQAGSVLGGLAREVTGLHDVVFPTAGDDIILVMPVIDAMANEYGLDRIQVRQFSALRAAAQRVVFEGFPLVRTHFFALYHNYVASLDIDMAAGMQALQGLDFSDPARLQEALGDEGLFSPKPSPQAAHAAARIASFMGLVEAYIAAAVDAASARLGDGGKIAEAFRRRTAAPTKGQQTFAQFLGMEELPSRRPATAFVRASLDRGGWALLGRALDEPDACPTADELAAPERWLGRMS